MKKTYEKPQAELFLIQLEGSLLSNSVRGTETMNGVAGSWEDDDESWD